MQKSSPGEREWPYCSALEGMCLFFDAGRHLGKDVRSAMLTFVFSAEEGARMILQRNRDGFTLQITGAVERGHDEPVDLAEARELNKRLDVFRRKTDE